MYIAASNNTKQHKIMDILLNELADIERELAQCVCNYQTLILEWQDARKTMKQTESNRLTKNCKKQI